MARLGEASQQKHPLSAWMRVLQHERNQRYPQHSHLPVPLSELAPAGRPLTGGCWGFFGPIPPPLWIRALIKLSEINICEIVNFVKILISTISRKKVVYVCRGYTSAMDAILLLSHGSLLCGAGETLQAVAERLRARGDAPVVEVGYLNYSQPAFEAAFAACIAQGATRIVVVPYFLVTGKFVQVDVPRRISAVWHAYSSIKVTVAGALDFHPLLADAVIASAISARATAEWHEPAAQIARVCRAAPDCPRYGTGACPGGMSAGTS